MTYKQIWKIEKDNKYANITSYIQKMQFILLITGQKWSHPHGDDQSQMKKKRVHNNRDTKESKKYGCVCTYCHRNDLPWYQCVIFVRRNYNFNIPAVANALSKWYRDIRQKEFICKPCHKELKDSKYSKNVQILICLGLM